MRKPVDGYLHKKDTFKQKQSNLVKICYEASVHTIYLYQKKFALVRLAQY